MILSTMAAITLSMMTAMMRLTPKSPRARQARFLPKTTTLVEGLLQREKSPMRTDQPQKSVSSCCNNNRLSWNNYNSLVGEATTTMHLYKHNYRGKQEGRPNNRSWREEMSLLAKTSSRCSQWWKSLRKTGSLISRCTSLSLSSGFPSFTNTRIKA